MNGPVMLEARSSTETVPDVPGPPIIDVCVYVRVCPPYVYCKSTRHIRHGQADKPVVAALLAKASAAVVRLRLTSDGKIKIAGKAPPDLLARLRERKAGLVDLLSANVCRHCSEPMTWPGPAGITFADSPETLADEAEVTMRGEFE